MLFLSKLLPMLQLQPNFLKRQERGKEKSSSVSQFSQKDLDLLRCRMHQWSYLATMVRFLFVDCRQHREYCAGRPAGRWVSEWVGE